MPPMVHGAAGGMKTCVRTPRPALQKAHSPLSPAGVYASRAIADKEAVEARQIQLALREAFDEIDDDGGCELATPHAPQPCPTHVSHQAHATQTIGRMRQRHA
jgi:hypothetical protein